MKFLRDGGWVVALAVALSLAAAAYHVMIARPVWGSRAVGDGTDPASYGFTFEPCAVDCAEIVASGSPRDRLHALDQPEMMTAEEAASLREGGHGNRHLLLPGDRVIGLSVGEEARAYPLSILQWHEVVNDIVGGVPRAVVYQPLTDTAVALDRRAAVAGEQSISFGWSGLLLDSGALLYDRQPDDGAGASLWSALDGRPIAGPAAAADGVTLDQRPVSLVRWEDWLAEHPDTQVLAPDPARTELYRMRLYESYQGSDVLRFPVDPPPPADGPPAKTQAIVVGTGGDHVAYSIPAIYARAGADGTWIAQQGDHVVRFETRQTPTVFVDVTPPDPDLDVLHTTWFAWHAAHPGSTLVE